jgi:calnexin
MVIAILLTPLASCQEDSEFDVDGDDDIASDEFDDLPPPAHDHDHDDDGSREARIQFERPVYKKPTANGAVYFTETFESDAEFKQRWVVSQAKKDNTDDALAKYDGQWSIEEPREVALKGDLGLVLKLKAKHYAVSAKLEKPFDFSPKSFVVQYEVKFQNGQECGGAYLKLLTADSGLDLTKFYDKTPYTVMFGPDKCGNDHKLHFIFRHKNPLTGVFEEKHAKKPAGSLEKFFTDKKSHLYTLVVSSDNSFEIYVDQDLVNSGNLLQDMNPPVNPPKEIADINDKKPSDWDDREKVPDPDAVKPESWDETQLEMIPDETAEKPEGWLDDEPELVPDISSERPDDWDDEMDGEWEPPMINNPKCDSAPGCGEWVAPKVKNPKYKGKWVAPMIDNPNYKGKWTPRMIPNPEYYEDTEPYRMTPISAVGLELWSVSDDILFDNIIITDDKKTADDWADQTWLIKHGQEMAGAVSARSVIDAVMDATNERPWLWVVFAVVIVLPVFMLIVYCCMPASKRDETPVYKKTDRSTPDTVDDANHKETTDDAGKEPNVGDIDSRPSTTPDTRATQRKGRGKSSLNADVSPRAGKSSRSEKDN